MSPHKTRTVSSLYRLAAFRHTVTLPLSDTAGSRTHLFTISRWLHAWQQRSAAYQGASQKLPSEYRAAITARFSFFCFLISFNPWNTHPREDFGLRTLYHRIHRPNPRCFYSQLRTEAQHTGGGLSPTARALSHPSPTSELRASDTTKPSPPPPRSQPSPALATPLPARPGGEEPSAPPSAGISGRVRTEQDRPHPPLAFPLPRPAAAGPRWERGGAKSAEGGPGWLRAAAADREGGVGRRRPGSTLTGASEGGKEGRKAPLPGLRSPCAGERASGRRVRVPSACGRAADGWGGAVPRW